MHKLITNTTIMTMCWDTPDDLKVPTSSNMNMMVSNEMTQYCCDTQMHDATDIDG